MTDDTPPPKHAGGRPTDYRPEYCEMVVADMAEGYSIGAFAGLIGVARSTIQRWAAENPEFSVALSRGKAARLRQWETAGLKAANTQFGGNATIIAFGLSNAGRGSAGEDDEWISKSTQEHTGKEGGAPIRIDATDDRRKAALALLLAKEPKDE